MKSSTMAIFRVKKCAASSRQGRNCPLTLAPTNMKGLNFELPTWVLHSLNLPQNQLRFPKLKKCSLVKDLLTMKKLTLWLAAIRKGSAVFAIKLLNADDEALSN